MIYIIIADFNIYLHITFELTGSEQNKINFESPKTLVAVGLRNSDSLHAVLCTKLFGNC